MSQEIKDINISDLKLDLHNPRLPKSKQGKDQKTIIEFMLLEAATLELMLAIGENDFFAGELLLVVPDNKERDKYIVIEGNRRLTAVLLLNEPELAIVKKIAISEIIEKAKFKPTIVPCLIFNNRDEIMKYLGFIHITGKKSWRLLEKARYLYDLSKSNNFKNHSFLDSLKEIAKVIGSNSAYVKRLLISFELYKIVEDEGFYGIGGLDDTSFFLNYFTDGLNKDNIRRFINVKMDSDKPIENLKSENLKKLIKWWFEKSEGKSRVLGNSEDLKKLDAVLGNEIALSAFENGRNIEEAYELTNDVDKQFEQKIRKSLEMIEQADVLSNRVKSFYDKLYDDLKNIRKIANKINDFRSNLERAKDDF